MIDRKIKDKAYFKSLLDISTKDTYVSFVNPFSYEVLSGSPGLVCAVDHFFIDGNLLKMLHNFFHRDHQVDRVSFDFSSIAGDVFTFCLENKLRVALIGATQSELSTALGNIEKLYPKLDVKYLRNGFFNSEDEILKSVIEINNVCVDIVIIGMGSPCQEYYLSVLKKHLNSVMLCLTCGGFFSQTSLRPDYYYPIVKKLNLMWLQRMVLHKHVRERVLKIYPKFIVKYLSAHICTAGSDERN